jgi:hypothetical protein
MKKSLNFFLSRIMATKVFVLPQSERLMPDDVTTSSGLSPTFLAKQEEPKRQSKSSFKVGEPMGFSSKVMD